MSLGKECVSIHYSNETINGKELFSIAKSVQCTHIHGII